MKAERLSTKMPSDTMGEWRHYRLSPPLEGHEYVIVSASTVLLSGPETYIFPADEKGNVTDWAELDGSFRGDRDHNRALRSAGYTVSEAA